MSKKTIKSQFNKQADKFSKFSLTKDERILEFFFNYCNLDQHDCLLDVACGSGEFAVFCAKKLKYVYGLDITNKMIKLAEKKAHNNNLSNIKFLCSDVENIPLDNELFSVTTCRSAFHHMKNYEKVFSEMVRCVKIGNKICIQDMLRYKNEKVNNFFENIEKYIDISHNKALSEEIFLNLFERYSIKVGKKFVAELEHNLAEYMSHAVQSKKNLSKINKLVENGLNDSEISKFLYTKNNGINFKKLGIIIWGIKSK